MSASRMLIFCCVLSAPFVTLAQESQPDPDRVLELNGKATYKGKPVGGAKVVLIRDLSRESVRTPPPNIAETKTADDGTFTIRAKLGEIASGWIRVRSRDLEAKIDGSGFFANGKTELDEQIAFELIQCRRIDVVVRSADSEPVPNAFVRMKGYRDIDYGKTNEFGLVTLFLPDRFSRLRSSRMAGRPNRITAVASGVGTGEYLTPGALMAREKTTEGKRRVLNESGGFDIPKTGKPIVIVLKPERLLTVKVLDRQSRPLRNQMVRAMFRMIGHQGRSNGAKAKTNADGQVAFNLMPSVEDVQVTLQDPKYKWYRSVTHRVADGNTVQLDEKDLTLVSGQLTHKGKPARDVQVRVESGNHDTALFTESVKTDDDGRYELRTLPGVAAKFYVSHKTLAAPVYHTTIDPKDVEQVDFAVTEKVTLSGRVFLDGKPLTNATPDIEINGSIYNLETDAGGRFEMLVPVGRHRIRQSEAEAYVSVGVKGLRDFDVRLINRGRQRRR